MSATTTAGSATGPAPTGPWWTPLPDIGAFLPWIALAAVLTVTASSEYELAVTVLKLHPSIAWAVPVAIDTYVIAAFRAKKDVAAAMTVMGSVLAAATLAHIQAAANLTAAQEKATTTAADATRAALEAARAAGQPDPAPTPALEVIPAHHQAGPGQIAAESLDPHISAIVAAVILLVLVIVAWRVHVLIHPHHDLDQATTTHPSHAAAAPPRATPDTTSHQAEPQPVETPTPSTGPATTATQATATMATAPSSQAGSSPSAARRHLPARTPAGAPGQQTPAGTGAPASAPRGAGTPAGTYPGTPPGTGTGASTPTSAPVPEDAEILAELRTRLADGVHPPPSLRSIKATYKVGQPRAARLLAEATAQANAPAPQATENKENQLTSESPFTPESESNNSDPILFPIHEPTNSEPHPTIHLPEPKETSEIPSKKSHSGIHDRLGKFDNEEHVLKNENVGIPTPPTVPVMSVGGK